jgi:hypothetical protein
VPRLARERTLAEGARGSSRDTAARPRRSCDAVAYGEAKADYDEVIAGLVVALTRVDLQARLQRGFDIRAADNSHFTLAAAAADSFPKVEGPRSEWTEGL